MRRSLFASLALAPVLATPSAAFAQCGPQWIPTNPTGFSSFIKAFTMWDPDGPGPRNAVLVAAGNFTTAGNVAANRIASWNGVEWTPLGVGLGGAANALAVMPSGDLIAAGDFTTAGGATAARIARWNGTSWSPLGSGVSSSVYALAVLPTGQLVAGGSLFSAGGAPAARIAQWNGSAWSAMGSGVTGVDLPRIQALMVRGNDLIAAGVFASAGGVPANRIARWSNGAWSSLGVGVEHLDSSTIGIYALALTRQRADHRRELCQLHRRLRQWVGAMGRGRGVFDGPGVGPNLDSSGVRALTVTPSGDVIVAGRFTLAGGAAAANIARWNSGVWSTMGAGITGSNSGVSALATHPSGEVIVGGSFTTAGGQPASHFARWTATNIPWIAVHPVPAATPCGGPATFTITAAAGYGGLSYRWRRDGVEIDPVSNPSAATPALNIDAAGALHAGAYDCVLSSACGSETSASAILTLTSHLLWFGGLRR